VSLFACAVLSYYQPRKDKRNRIVSTEGARMQKRAERIMRSPGTTRRCVAASLCATTIVAAPTIRAADGEIEEIVVTGSRIARPDFESASPIVTVDAEAFARTGATAVDATLNRLPQFTPAFTSTSNNPGNDGQANLQLRGLGTTATLVLVDGRRLIPANTNGVVDLNLLRLA
jgi:outer membrane cobalamin receptor